MPGTSVGYITMFGGDLKERLKQLKIEDLSISIVAFSVIYLAPGLG